MADDDGEFHLGPPEGGPKSRTVWINSVPEPIAGKSRAHIDVRVAGGDPKPLLDAGGTLERQRDDDIGWDIVNDPDGVAVCVFGPHPADPKALAILAKTIYRELRASGYAERDVMALAGELLGMVATEVKGRRTPRND